MKLTVKFPVINDVKINESWSILKGDKRFFLKLENGWLKEIQIVFEGLPENIAPSMTNSPQSGIKAEIHFRDTAHVLQAEHYVRAWQTILTPYILIEVDYDRVGQTYTPEEGEKTVVHAFNKSPKPLRNFGAEAFEVFAGAFLSAESAMSRIEEMSFYRDAEIARRSGRYVDAYNGFFLFLETKLGGGKFKERELVRRFLSDGLLMNTLKQCIRDLSNIPETSWPSLIVKDGQKRKEEEIVREIILTRGKLRHHSLSNPNRWNPNQQTDYASDAGFLAQLCFHIAFAEVTSSIWHEDIKIEFAKQAKENKMTTRVVAKASIKSEDVLQDRTINIEVPQKTLDGALAQFILEKVLKHLSENEPGAQILSIRAETEQSRDEVLRYDIGPKLLR